MNYGKECWIRRQGVKGSGWLNYSLYRDLFQELVGDNRVAADNNRSIGMVPSLSAIWYIHMQDQVGCAC